MSAIITAAVTSAIIASSISAGNSGGSGLPITDVGGCLLFASLTFFVIGLGSMLTACARSKFDRLDDFLIEKGLFCSWIIALILFLVAFGHDIYVS